MFRTLLPALLLGFTGNAMAETPDDTMSVLASLADEAPQGPAARERGGSRGGGAVQGGSRSNGSTRQSYRTDGQRTQTHTVQRNDAGMTRSRTEGTVTGGHSRSGENAQGQTLGQRTGGYKTRSSTTIDNGERSITHETGESWRGSAQRETNGMGDHRTVGQAQTRTRDGWTMEGPNGVARRGTTGSSEAIRGDSTRGPAFQQRDGGIRGDQGNSGPHAPGRPAAIPGGRPHTPNGSNGGSPQGPRMGGDDGRVGHAPPRASGGPNGPRPGYGPVRGGSSHHVPVRGYSSGRPVVVHNVAHHHVTYTHVRPYHGVFVYGPRPVTHVQYVNDSGPVQVAQRDLPERDLNRDDSVAVGIKGGSLISGYVGGNNYSDLGLGIAGRYRPDEAVGLELAIQHHDQTWAMDSERSQTQFAGSVELFAWPWTRVSPYVLGGLTYTSRDIKDEIVSYDGLANVETGAPLVGPHAGLGLELALGKSLAIDLEARYVGYLNRKADDASLPGALTTTAGVMVHF